MIRTTLPAAAHPHDSLIDPNNCWSVVYTGSYLTGVEAGRFPSRQAAREHARWLNKHPIFMSDITAHAHVVDTRVDPE